MRCCSESLSAHVIAAPTAVGNEEDEPVVHEEARLTALVARDFFAAWLKTIAGNGAVPDGR